MGFVVASVVPGEHSHKSALTCLPLENTCVSMLPSSNCSGFRAPFARRLDCERHRPLRFDLYGARGAASMAAFALHKRMGHLLRDTLHGFSLRHVERDMFAHPVDPFPPGSPSKAEIFTMMWPRFENGYGDPWRNTLMPLALERMRGGIPARIGFSGWKHARQALDALRRLNHSFCATERSGAGLPRCKSACYKRVQVCAPVLHPNDHNLYYAAVHALDSAAYRIPNLGFAKPALSASRDQVRVVFATRVGRRFVQNMAELAETCNRSFVRGRALSCERVQLATLEARQLVKIMREADVAVFM